MPTPGPALTRVAPRQSGLAAVGRSAPTVSLLWPPGIPRPFTKLTPLAPRRVPLPPPRATTQLLLDILETPTASPARQRRFANDDGTPNATSLRRDAMTIVSLGDGTDADVDESLSPPRLCRGAGQGMEDGLRRRRPYDAWPTAAPVFVLTDEETIR